MFSISNGRLSTLRDPVKIVCRNWILWLLQLLPSLRHRLSLGPRALGMDRYTYEDGMAFLPEHCGGISLPQVYCRPIITTSKSTELPVQLTDDVIFKRASKSIIRLVVLPDNPAEVETIEKGVRDLHLESISGGEVNPTETCFIVQSPTAELGPHSAPSVGHIYRIATGDEFASSPLCTDRPKPAGYDMYRMKKDLGGRKYIFVRSDRFVFAACSSLEELRVACARIPETLTQIANSDH